jgi:cytochrome P450
MIQVSPSYIPEGTTTFIPTYCLQRDPCNFSPLPDNFLPERWLPAEKQLELELAIFKDQSKVVHNLDAFIPFSTGPSNCVGKNLAWMEMRMLVCLMLQRYDMQFEEGYCPKLWEDDIQDYFVMMKGRLPIVLAPRK